jgi:methyl-accepting chemotaxis protein
MKLNLLAKFLLPTLAVIILGMGLASFLSYQNASQALWTELLASSQHLASSLSHSASIFVKDMQATTIATARRRVMQEACVEQLSDAALKVATAAMTEVRELNSAVTGVWLMRPDGLSFAGSEANMINVKYGDREYFKKAIQGVDNISNPILGRTAKKPVIIIASPVRDKDKVLGVLALRIDLGKYSELLIDPIKIGNNGYAFMIDKTGLITAHPNKELLFKQNISELDWGRKILSQQSGVVEYTQDGQESAAIFSKDDSSGWTVILTVNRSDIAAATQRVRNTSLLVNLAAVVAACVAIFLIANGVLRGLQICVRYASAVSGGQLDSRLELKRNDELGALSDSLRAMVSKLKQEIENARQKTCEAEEQNALACQATRAADEARAEADRARREGMVHAAEKLQSVVAVVTSASKEISGQIEDSSQGASLQSTRISETATAMEEMNATVLEVARSASQAAETADRTRQKAEGGAKIVGEVVNGIGQVQNQALELKADMGELGKQAEGIGHILNVISDIADQTNLLALNAAIEAARAGEAGRGFAVVADEVRKLAEKTMTATKQVDEAIRGVQNGARKNIDNVEKAVKAIENATTLADKSGDSLREILGLADEVADQVRSIATASEQQSATSEEINRNIEDVRRLSLEAAQAMQHSARAVEEMSEQANALRTLIKELESDV